ncbi:P2X purinoceptor 4-like [Sphaeramia orbicularis]|uniref:P2X purinoceptor 4-like n=1 Tax=Sphaeramia orbicularis TaxID=375764 RepID=UPI001181182B|nr:P2X purinoceptor 4-like [Sphaeramia orbicularis]
MGVSAVGLDHVTLNRKRTRLQMTHTFRLCPKPHFQTHTYKSRPRPRIPDPDPDPDAAMRCGFLLSLCQYETTKLVRIQSVRLGSLKWALNGTILLVICIMMLWNKKYQEFDPLVSSVTAKVKGVAQTRLPGLGEVVWDVVDYSGPFQDKNSFFVVTNVIVTKNQKQGKCPEVPVKGRLCRTDKDCEKGYWDHYSHGVQTGSCVRFDVLKKTCEVSAWCPIEAKTNPPRPALLAAAENFTILIKNNIRFPAFNYIR